MTAKELLNTIKVRLAEIAAPAAPAVPAPAPAPAPPAPADNPADANKYKLQDGSEVSIDKLEVGGMVTKEGAPCAEGSYTLEDGTVLAVDATGAITAVTPKVEPQPDFSNPEVMRAAFADGSALDLKTLSTMVKALFENVYGWQLKDAKDKEAIAAYQESFKAQEAKIEALQKVNADLLTVVEQLAEVPADEPANKNKNIFEKQSPESKEDKFKAIGEAIKELKKDK